MIPKHLTPRLQLLLDFLKAEATAGKPFPNRNTIARFLSIKDDAGATNALMTLYLKGHLEMKATGRKKGPRYAFNIVEGPRFQPTPEPEPPKVEPSRRAPRMVRAQTTRLVRGKPTPKCFDVASKDVSAAVRDAVAKANATGMPLAKVLRDIGVTA